MKALFFEIINDRLIQVDQRDIPNYSGRIYTVAYIPPTNLWQINDLKEAIVHSPEVQEKRYFMVSPPYKKLPALFILEDDI
jgi:hypothetical protein